jgi:putative phosphoesterase
MTRILILSDTHLPREISSLKGLDGEKADVENFLDRLADYFGRADLILHAGDHTEDSFYEALRQKGNLKAVHGNMDAPELKEALPEYALIPCEGVRIGLMHGWGAPWDLPERVFHAWPEPKPDVLVFGHTHEAYHRRRGDILLLNPGSATNPRGGRHTIGWLEINGTDYSASIISLSSPPHPAR